MGQVFSCLETLTKISVGYIQFLEGGRGFIFYRRKRRDGMRILALVWATLRCRLFSRSSLERIRSDVFFIHVTRSTRLTQSDWVLL